MEEDERTIGKSKERVRTRPKKGRTGIIKTSIHRYLDTSFSSCPSPKGSLVSAMLRVIPPTETS